MAKPMRSPTQKKPTQRWVQASEDMLISLAKALEGAASEVDRAQVMLQQERRTGQEWDEAESELRRALRSIEDNLTEASIGLRLFRAADQCDA